MKIYIGNLPHEISEEDLLETFESFGEVKSLRLIENESGESCILEMPDESDAKSVINKMDGEDLKGKKVQVHTARVGAEDRRRPERGGGRRKTDNN